MFITPLIVFPVYLYFNRMKVHETHEQGLILTYDNKCTVIPKEATYIGNRVNMV